MIRPSPLRRLVSALAARLRRPEPEAAPRFGERLAAAIARDEGVLLRVAALEKSLMNPNPSNQNPQE